MSQLTPMERLVLVDTETFGLDFETDPIVELGFLIVDLDLNPVDSRSWLIWNDSMDRLLRAHAEDDTFVYKMHVKSGLWDDARAKGSHMTNVIDSVLEWLVDIHGVGKEDPMVGSSVQFDRGMLHAQMLEIEEQFSYRNIDTSSIKELCRRWNPRVYDHLDAETTPKKLHRVDPDLEDTVNELKFYFDNFLWTA